MKEEIETAVDIDKTDQQQEAKRIEDLLISEGVMIPGNDLVHYMTRNASYMRLISSDAFKESGISLEEILDEKFIQEEFAKNKQTAQIMRFVTEKVVEVMHEVKKDTEEYLTEDNSDGAKEEIVQ